MSTTSRFAELPTHQKSVENDKAVLYTAWAFCEESLSAQVAQAVERSPEKAGVGGSTPSLGTITPSFSLRSPLELTNLILILQRQSDVVEAVQQAVTAKPVDLKPKFQSVI